MLRSMTAITLLPPAVQASYKDMVLADTLSHAYISDEGDNEVEKELKCAVHLVVSTVLLQ